MTTTMNTESIISTYPGVSVAALRRAVKQVDPGGSARLEVRGGYQSDPWVVYIDSVPLGACGNLGRTLHREIVGAL